MMDAHDLLIADCWVEIFNKLEPEDLFNISEVCDLFRYITSEARYGFYEGEWKFDLILPQLIPYLGNCYNIEDALKPRLVCKSWLNSIDKILEENNIWPELSLGTTDEIDDFLERFGASNESPIFMRRVCLDRERNEELGEEEIDDALYYSRALVFAQRFGMNVWEVEGWMLRPIFLQLLQHLPNLKTFRVHEAGARGFDVDENGNWLRHWMEYALPDLPHFKSFEADWTDLVTSRILRKYGGQFEHLFLQRFDAFYKLSLEDHRGLVQRFRALKTFEFNTLIQYSSNIFATLQYLNCPLEFMKIGVHSNIIEEPWQIDSFLRSISHLQLLRNLKIELSNVYISSGQLQLDYSNPNITHLEIYFRNDTDQNKMSLCFLPALTQLQHLTCDFRFDQVIQLGLQTSVDLRDGIEFEEFLGNHQIRQYHLYEASHSNNIWVTCPTLMKVTFAFWKGPFQFSREECDEYRNLRAQITE